MHLRAVRWFLLAISLAATAAPAIEADISADASADSLPDTTASSWIYRNGVFYWPGDWSGSQAKIDYADTVGDPGKTDIAVKIEAPWGFWLPYCPQVGPDINGYKVPSCNLSTYTSIKMHLKATIARQKWSLTIYKYNIKNGVLYADTVVGSVPDLRPYGGDAVDGEFVTYTIPLADLGASGLTTMYKMLLQDETGYTGQKWYVNFVKFE